METENHNKVPSLEELQQKYDEFQKKKQECWKELQPILDKHNFAFSSTMNITDMGNVKFIIDLVEKKSA